MRIRFPNGAHATVSDEFGRRLIEKGGVEDASKLSRRPRAPKPAPVEEPTPEE